MAYRPYATLTAACILAAATLVLARPAGAQLVRFEDGALTIETGGNGRHAFRVEIARSDRQHAQGLMFRRRLAADAGMLFVYRHRQPIGMWMKNTNIPLDMLFIEGDGRIVRIAQRTVPFSLETISSGQPVVAVLELNGGTVARLKIRRGDRVVSDALQKRR